MLLKSNTYTESSPLTHGYGELSYLNDNCQYLGKYLRNVDFSSKNPVHFLSDGRFSLQDVILFFLSKETLSDVTISSLSISEVAARNFLLAKRKLLIENLSLVLNVQKKHLSTKGISILRSFASMKFVHIHAKLGLIKNEMDTITILTSSNLTRNENRECGVIFFDKPTFDYYSNFLQNVSD